MGCGERGKQRPVLSLMTRPIRRLPGWNGVVILMKRAVRVLGWALGALAVAYLLFVAVMLHWGSGDGGLKEQGWTALHNSVAHVDNPKEVERLIAEGEQVNARNTSGNTPLHLVKSAAVARVLLRHGADVNARGMDGGTPLQFAASGESTGVVLVLIRAGANLNSRDDNGRTPLHEAAWNGRNGAAATLLTAGADVNARDSNGSTPLHEAILNGQDETARLLRPHGGRE